MSLNALFTSYHYVFGFVLFYENFLGSDKILNAQIKSRLPKPIIQILCKFI